MTIAAQPGGAAAPAPQPASGPQATGWWGMATLIATEGTLFVMLLFSYYYIRWNSPRWPPDGIKLPDFTYIIPATILLLASSGPYQWAEAGIRRGRRWQLILGIVVAVVFALTFMALELWEWTHLEYGPQTNAYGSLFFTITGIHLAHVTVAITFSIYILLRAFRGDFDTGHTLAVENATLYWHFVDVIWVLVFSTVYISPYIR